jgi:3-deoxy-D-manno-octulosonic-acid transferase
VLTFFSPSGYEVRKHYAGADAVLYLPLDTREAADRFVETLQPIAAIFIKYDLWLNHIAALAARRIPIYLVAARFRQDQVFFRPWGGWHRNALRQLTRIFCQDEDSVQYVRLLLARTNSGAQKPELGYAPDTRFDRVLQVAAAPVVPEALRTFAAGASVLVAGSTWPADERLLSELCRQALMPRGWKLLIAPHEMHPAALQELCESLPGTVLRWSEIEAGLPPNPRQPTASEPESNLRQPTASEPESNPHQSTASGPESGTNTLPASGQPPAAEWPASQSQNSVSDGITAAIAKADCLIVDKIGLLSSLYALGSAAYIGGGFGAGIHNTLEAAVYGLPLAFGPRYQKFREAEELVALGAATSIRDSAALTAWFEGLLEPGVGTSGAQPPGLNATARATGQAAAAYVQARGGGTAMILQALLADLARRSG